MKALFKFLFVIILSFAYTGAFAQAQYDVSGTVTNEKGEPLKGATIFISGSERIMSTTDDGRFRFSRVPSGTFKLSVQMMGYDALTRNIIVKDAPLIVSMQLTTKSIVLTEVKIGAKSAWERNLKLFKENFLGRSANAKQCIIINPKAINFSTKKGLLMADADEFLIIENKRLGYRINYQLKDFRFNSVNNIVLYNNECSFEELDGTEKQKEEWAKNRLETYKGSFMHFLRSVHANNTLANGFITRQFYGYPSFKYDGAIIEDPNRVIINNRQVMYDSLITAVDTNLISFKFKQFYIAYDPKKAMRFQENSSNNTVIIPTDKKGSMLKLALQEAIIDKKGSYTDYRDFFIQGYWARARVGDQLPVEYKPPVADIPRGEIPTDKLLTVLRNWTDSLPQEKIYLHMDKPYYALGDTIWFKGYLTTGSRHQLLPISGAVYVDLINEQNQPVKTLKLPVKSGTVAGNLILGDDIKAGSYRVRAYTQWMRNAGDDYFFDKTITIGNPAILQDKNSLQTSLQQTDVQFFPESGNLVSGITSRLGFKATGPDGLGVTISGTITDNDNNAVALINTLHAGMGNFLLKPLPGKTYTALIKFADSTTKKIMLPAALNAGYVLSVYQPGKDSVMVRIHASDTLQHSTVNLLVHSSGEIIFTAQITINGAVTSVWLDKKLFPSGIAQFTIFGANNQPLNERIAFIKNDDHMRLAIKTEKTVYKSREQVQLVLNAEDNGGTPIAANFSAAVIDESKVPVDGSAESTIFSYILLSADIKGYIEKPNYYFTTDTGDVNKALDNLMLTQGYRRFEWRSLTNKVNTRPYFNSEGFGITISGFVKSLTHLPVRDGSVLLVSTNARINKVTTTSANGTFKFDNLVFADGARFAVQARNVQGNERAIIEIDSVPKVKVSPKQNLAEVNIIKTILKKAQDEGTPVQLSGSHVLKQVDIKATKYKPEETATQGMLKLMDEQSADKILTIPDPENYPTLEMFLNGRMGSISIQMNPTTGYKQLMSSRRDITVATEKVEPLGVGAVLNGRPLGADELNDVLTGSIQPEDIAKILLVTHNLAALNALGSGTGNSGGVLLIITKPYSARKQYNPYIANIQPKGFNAVRQFYSPRYDRPNTSDLPDLRTTIFWDPYINTDVNGKATLNFFNADGPGTYRVVVEGINAAGELGRQVFTYKVE
ncbi:carboxypeptidase regulatory-like domain-containing protein [Mucilaginibacter sp. UYCu711]|uniref:carboxypeptidase regulatory-like domain-containing protein n=1 Tax=Mucilaginibacter sp. UYCu711 TaxID=3156339 RepID=UPI003D1B1168